MKKRFIISTLMVLFVSTVAFAQTYGVQPAAGGTYEVFFDATRSSYLGPAPKYYYFDILLDGEINGSRLFNSPHNLGEVNSGIHTVEIIYYYRTNPNNDYLSSIGKLIIFTVGTDPLPCGCLPGQCSH